MGRVLIILLALIILAAAAGAIYLLTWDIPAPSQEVERVLPDDRFPD